MTAMTAQISTTRITWLVLTELVLVMTDARNGPKHDSCLGCDSVGRQGMQRYSRGADAKPDRAQAHGDVRPCGLAGLDATLCQPGVYLLVDLRADPLDQPLGHRTVIRSAELGMNSRRYSDVLMCQVVHGAKIYRDRRPGNGYVIVSSCSRCTGQSLSPRRPDLPHSNPARSGTGLHNDKPSPAVLTISPLPRPPGGHRSTAAAASVRLAGNRRHPVARPVGPHVW